MDHRILIALILATAACGSKKPDDPPSTAKPAAPPATAPPAASPPPAAVPPPATLDPASFVEVDVKAVASPFSQAPTWRTAPLGLTPAA